MSVLPATLLEFTLLRAATRLRFLSVARCCGRRLHTQTLVATSLSKPPPLQKFTDQDIKLPQIHHENAGLLSELEKRVQSLQEAAEREKPDDEPPSFSEEELCAFYEDLLDVSAIQHEGHIQLEHSAVTKDVAKQDLATISAIEQRLLDSFPPTDEEPPHLQESDVVSEDVSQPYQRLLAQLHGIITRLEAVQGNVTSPDQITSGTQFAPLRQFFPVSVISVNECEAFVRVSLRAQDNSAAEKALDIMKRAGMPIPVHSVTDTLRSYANAGKVANFEQAMAKYLSDTPSDEQRHLHFKAHLNATATDSIPSSALQVLHNYELQSHPAPIQTYTLAITSLFSRHSSLARAQAWDLFSHMRYVAHPQPDALLYTLMIRACASPISSARTSEPERALDLWTEMTVNHQLTPTAGAYNAVILACAKSGLKRYVNEAFRLAKEMLDSHRDAKGKTAFRPTRKTFCALLEGAKRIGDLARARWILAEMIRGVDSQGHAESDTTVNEEVMMHVFHAYAAYKPPFVRSIAPVSKDDVKAEAESSTVESSPPVPEISDPAFTHIPPQSRQEVTYEASVLFHRILVDTGRSERHAEESLPTERKFQHVTLTTRLLNSYISVFYRHSTLETSRDMFWKLYDDLGIERSALTYVEALERCARAKNGRERQLALQFIEELWTKWETMESSKRDINNRPLSARLIERAHVALIRTLSLTGDLDKAMACLREFANKYPPQHLVRQPTPPMPDFRSTRTSLVGARPLVRLTSNADVPDDNVPPFLTFADIEVLHHRLVASERQSAWEQIGYIKWLCKAYEWALRVRRHEAQKERTKPNEMPR